MTFVSILLSSLYEPATSETNFRCGLHPVEGRIYSRSAAIDYAADMNLLLAWYKCDDDMLDSPGLRSAAEVRLLKKAADRVRAAYPDKDARIAALLKKNNELEKAGCTDLDILCRLSGAMLAETLVWKEDAFAGTLRQIGMALGSFIYLMDAYEDFDKDLKHGCFNPLRKVHEQEDYEPLIKDLLTMTASDAVNAL